jgi:two-component system sensor histidine kinase PilS (NtrC family)
MDFRSRASSPGEEGRLRKLTLIRLAVATLVVVAAIMVQQYDNQLVSVVALYGLLGMLYLSTGMVYVGFWAGISFRSLLCIQIFVDIVVLTMIMHYSGGSNSYFTILYILPILMAGVYLQLFGGLAAAVLATSIYILYTSLEVSGNLPFSGGEWIVSQKNIYRLLVKSYLHTIVFILAGMVSGYVSKRFLSRGEELAERERELKSVRLSTDSILNNMSSGLVVTDMEGMILAVNPAALEILGLDPDEKIEGKDIREMKPFLSKLVSELELAIETGTPRRRGEIQVESKSGAIVPLGLSISILRDEKGEEKGGIVLFQDLAEVHRMREKIRQADKMAAIGRLSASIAHEIRAPLASICGSIEMLKGELDLSGENRELMDLIMKESDRLDNIINDFLEFARMKKPALSSIDVEKCLKEVVMLLRHSSMQKKRIAMEIECGCPGARILADDEQIRQVFLNIMINACEAMEPHGAISIGIAEEMTQIDEEGVEEQFIRVDFENDGPPIPADVLPHLFEPFFTTKEGGTGLGLAIAARIIESHKGQIKVESREDSSTLFSVFIPVQCEQLEKEYPERIEVLQTFACI